MTMKPYKLPLPWSRGHLPHRDGDGYGYGGEETICIPDGPTLIVGCGSRAKEIADHAVRAANAHDALVAVLRCAKALRAREMELANEAKWMYVDDLNRGFLAGELDRALAAPELAGLLKEISDAK